MKESHAKLLTKNDTGETGGHQGGITIPKKNSVQTDFFPVLNSDEFNPEAWIFCKDPDGETWKMRYVYYNGKTFSPRKSTRNEYRITYMTKFFSKWGAKTDDSVVFTATSTENYFDICIKNNEERTTQTSITTPKTVILRGWTRVC
jgi:hypothetical protein